MDGEAICVAFGTVSGPDCLSSVIKTLGTRLKVYKFLKDIFDAEFEVFLRLYLILYTYLDYRLRQPILWPHYLLRYDNLLLHFVAFPKIVFTHI